MCIPFAGLPTDEDEELIDTIDLLELVGVFESTAQKLRDVGMKVNLCKSQLILYHLRLPIPADILDQENDPE